MAFKIIDALKSYLNPVVYIFGCVLQKILDLNSAFVTLKSLCKKQVFF